DSTLVQIEGDLVDINTTAKDKMLIIQAGNRMHEAIWPAELAQALPQIQRGSRIRLTGVEQIQFDEYRAPRAFRLLLRGPSDIVVVQTPPALTLERSLTVLGVLTVVIVFGVIWVCSLRQTVRAQTSRISSQLEHETRLQAQYRTIIENATDWIYTVDR